MCGPTLVVVQLLTHPVGVSTMNWLPLMHTGGLAVSFEPDAISTFFFFFLGTNTGRPKLAPPFCYIVKKQHEEPIKTQSGLRSEFGINQETWKFLQDNSFSVPVNALTPSSSGMTLSFQQSLIFFSIKKVHLWEFLNLLLHKILLKF